ncbi:MAG: hypothetical protein HUU23_15870 [Caldilineales bacterium]|nr:hypothetical protein [Caldilineales bacterium]
MKQSLPLRAMTADALTLSRLAAAALILWVGWKQGAASLPWVILILSAAWISDGIDGAFARRASVPTLLRRLDYAVDVSLAWATFIYLGLAGYLSYTFIVLYTILAAAAFLWFRRKAVLVLFMRGVDVLVAIIALRFAFLYTLPMIVWLLGLAYVMRVRLRQGVRRWWRDLTSLFSLLPLA